jgi:hypothetical protein
MGSLPRSTEFRLRREPAWRELEELVARVEREGVRSLPAPALARLPVLYRGALVTDADLAAVYSASDVLLATSKGEGFGIPTLEAMGCGVLYQSGIAPHVDHPIVTSLADIDRLHVPDPETTFPLNEVLKATRMIVAETAGRVFINGRADQGPVALALALCGPERFLTWVGEPENRSAVRGAASTSTFTSFSWPARSLASCSSAGVTIRQGAHHVAHRSTSAGTLDCSRHIWYMLLVGASGCMMVFVTSRSSPRSDGEPPPPKFGPPPAPSWLK